MERYTVESDTEEECHDEYNEERDLYYLCEGWYENVESDTDYSSYFAECQDIIAWCEIPKYED